MTGRPVTRLDCLPGGLNAARPCRQAWCPHHMDGAESCVLDVAGPGLVAEAALAAIAPGTYASGAGRTLDEVGVLLDLTRARIGQIEAAVLARPHVIEALSCWRPGGDGFPVGPTAPPAPPPSIHAARNQVIAERIRAGEEMNALAHEFDVTVRRIRQIARENGVRRKRGRPPRP